MTMSEELNNSLIDLSANLANAGEFGRVAIIDSALATLNHQQEQLAALRVQLAEAKAALEAAHDWLDQFGQHAPIVFGGEQELDDKLCAILAKI
jgi:hypothetical protein